MRKADAAVEIWVGRKYFGGCMYAIFVERKLDICALGEMTDLGIDSNLHSKKKERRERI